jgi:hypothetical protein
MPELAPVVQPSLSICAISEARQDKYALLTEPTSEMQPKVAQSGLVRHVRLGSEVDRQIG